MAATYKLYIDWLNNGDFTDLRDDVTARTLDQRTPLTTRVGRDQARALSPASAGTLGFEINNQSRDYSPENTSSPLNGLVQPGRAVYLKATFGGVDYTIYRGYLDDFTLKPDFAERSIDGDCLDALGRLNGVSVSTELYSGIRTGEAIGRVLDAVGWPADQRDLDPGATVMPFWWVDDTDAFTAVLALVDSEGPSALVTVDSGGRIVFRDRHHRLTQAASLTTQSTWWSSGNIEPLFSAPAAYNHGWKEIVNSIAYDVTVRNPNTADTVVWSMQGPLVVAAGDTVTITAKATDGFFNATVPVDGTDYQTLSGGVFVNLSRTSGGSTDISLTAAAGTTVITDLQLRARALNSTTVTIKAEDTTSIAAFGRRSLPDGRDPVWAGIYDAKAIADLILGKRSVRVPTISVTMVGGGSDQRLMQQLTRNLSDRVRIVEEHSGLDAECFIEQISHTIGQGGLEHRTTFGLEKAPATVSPILRFDTAGAGFDQGKFPAAAYDETATMFRFDTSGQGFDQGVFAN